MLRNILNILLLLGPLVLMAQKPSAGHVVQVHGQVLDSITGQLLQATVDVLVPGGDRPIAFTDTNTEGQYGLVLQQHSTFVLRVRLDGYKPYTRKMELSDQEVEHLILLQH